MEGGIARGVGTGGACDKGDWTADGAFSAKLVPFEGERRRGGTGGGTLGGACGSGGSCVGACAGVITGTDGLMTLDGALLLMLLVLRMLS